MPNCGVKNHAITWIIFNRERTKPSRHAACQRLTYAEEEKKQLTKINMVII